MRDGARWALVAALIFMLNVAWAGQDGQPNVRTETKVESKELPYQVQYEMSRTVGKGRIVKANDGKVGHITKTFKVTYQGDKLVKKELINTEREEPVNAVFRIGTQGYAGSRGSYVRGRVMTMNASAYDPSAGRGRNATFRTATGMRAAYGVVAVDPRVIPLGTHVYVEGYGFAIAADTGGAIKGNRIDLCMPTDRECRIFGRRPVKVHILKKP